MRSSRTSSPASGVGLAAHALGLTLDVRFDCPGLRPDRDVAGEVDAIVRLVTSAEIDASWPTGATRRTAERAMRGGRPPLTVDVDDRMRHRVDVPGTAAFLVSGDGAAVDCAPLDGDPASWQRALLAQVLPLSATLHGLEVLHASAVEIGGQAIGIVAPSGGGKSSVAASLVAAGHGFVTDDALALKLHADAVVAQPGPGLICLEDADAVGRWQLTHVGHSDKQHVEVKPVDRPLPLRRIYFLDRSGGGDGVEPLDVSPTRLLASTFNFYVRTRERLVRQLDVCARLARGIELFAVRSGNAADPGEVARSIETHATA